MAIAGVLFARIIILYYCNTSGTIFSAVTEHTHQTPVLFITCHRPFLLFIIQLNSFTLTPCEQMEKNQKTELMVTEPKTTVLKQNKKRCKLRKGPGDLQCSCTCFAKRLVLLLRPFLSSCHTNKSTVVVNTLLAWYAYITVELSAN